MAVVLLLASTPTIPISSSLTDFSSGTLTSYYSMPVFCSIFCNISSGVIKSTGTNPVKVKLFQITFINHNILVYIIFNLYIAGCQLFFVLNFFLREFFPLLKRIIKFCNQNKRLLLTISLRGHSHEQLFLTSNFYCLKNQVLRNLIVCSRQLLLISFYVGVSNIFKTVHHLLKLRASNKGIKQIRCYSSIFKLPYSYGIDVNLFM